MTVILTLEGIDPGGPLELTGQSAQLNQRVLDSDRDLVSK